MRLGLCLAGVPLAFANTYAPVSVPCPPSDQLLRLTNGSIAPAERDYVDGLLQASLPRWQTYAEQLYNISASPTLALAFSGGSLRSALFGAALIGALDERNGTSPIAGPLQGAAYVAGVSGGAWIAASYALSGGQSAHDLVASWQLERGLLQPSDNITELDAFYQSIERDVASKADELPTSITDWYGRAVAQKFGTSNNGSDCAGLLYSDIAKTEGWAAHSVPVPIIVFDSKPPSSAGDLGPTLPTQSTPIDATVFEATPWEFGSYDPQLQAFVNISYLFTSLKDGTPSQCWRGGDNYGFLLGSTAGTYVETLQDYAHGENDSGWAMWVKLTHAAALPAGGLRLFDAYKQHNASNSSYTSNVPNPFQFSDSQYEGAQSEQLHLLDGSDNGVDFVSTCLICLTHAAARIAARTGSSHRRDHRCRRSRQHEGQLRQWLVDRQLSAEVEQLQPAASTYGRAIRRARATQSAYLLRLLFVGAADRLPRQLRSARWSDARHQHDLVQISVQSP